jgi:hypothetical protein
MERFQGDLWWGGLVVAENVTGAWERHPPGSPAEWSGYLRPPAGAALRSGSSYVLELDDGRSGTIRVGADTGRPGVLQFEGLGRWL